VISSMKAIHESNKQFMEAMEENHNNMMSVMDVIRDIGEKTKVINDIVFQTKLLSFNASVEAARAGEYGKGFSVVAEEVGNLAQMSGTSSQEISKMLVESSQQVHDLLEATKSKISRLVDDGKAKIEMGLKVADESGQVLAQIVQDVQEVSQLMDSISQSSKEQAEGVSHISSALAEIDQSVSSSVESIGVANQNVDEVIKEARYLVEMTEALEGLVYGRNKAA